MIGQISDFPLLLHSYKELFSTILKLFKAFWETHTNNLDLVDFIYNFFYISEQLHNYIFSFSDLQTDTLNGNIF